MHLLKYLLVTSLGFTGIATCSATEPLAGNNTADISTSTASPIQYRKNIDEMTEAELAAYEHAVAMMKKKSTANIYDRSGFLWQAWVHNCTSVQVNQDRKFSVDDISQVDTCAFSKKFPLGTTHPENPGMCEHAKDTFFQWHRAEFYFYEKALQNADPEGKFGPSTRNVTVPYWNFTKKPTGKRYPKAFENPDSPLFHKRNDTPLSGPYAYTSPYLLAYLIYYHDWQTFGGYSVGGAGNYGSFESQIHNAMHSEYVGGALAAPPTAGLDPIFYVFHSFIDYIFEKWIEQHGTETITGGNIFMRGEQDSDVPKPIGFSEGTGTKRADSYLKNMGRGEIYYDTQKLGYAYQPGVFGEFIPKANLQAIIDKHQKAGFTFGDDKQSLFSELLSFGARGPVAVPKATFSGNTTIPVLSLGGKKATLDIIRAADSPDYSFQADVYIYPQHVTLNIASKNFRDRYLAVSTSYWGVATHHDHSATNGTADASPMIPLKVTQDLTDVINSLRRGGKAGQEWNITMAITSDGHRGNYAFSAPAITIK